MWIKRAIFNQMKAHIEKTNKLLEQYSDASVLISIERVDKVNRFTFLRGERTIVVETYSTLSDPLPQWKQELLR